MDHFEYPCWVSLKRLGSPRNRVFMFSMLEIYSGALLGKVGKKARLDRMDNGSQRYSTPRAPNLECTF